MRETFQQFWQPETPYLAVLALALALTLATLRPAERRSYLNTLWLFVAGLAGQLAGAAAAVMEFARTAEVLRVLFQVIAYVALLRLAGFAALRLLLPLVRLHPPRIVGDLLFAAAYAVLAVVQLRSAGLMPGEILATSAVVTAVVAFAMQDTLGNVLGGLALQLDDSIRVGDWLRVDEVTGRVVDIGWRSTLVETRNWETVVIPNSQLMKSRVMILGEREGQPLQWRRWIHFDVDPSVPPARVIAIVESAIQEAEIPGTARAPLGSCVLLGFQDGNLRYALRYWLTDLAADDPTDSVVRVHLFTALQRAAIRVAEPQSTRHIFQENEEHARAVHKREVQRRLHAIDGVDLFATLSAEERKALAERLQYAPFAAGDVMTRQGNTSHWLYIVTAGEADSMLELPDGGKRAVGKIGAGSYFGEMGMLTGAPRSTTVVAREDVECYRLDRTAFRDLLLARPEIAEEMSRTMTARASGLAAAREAAAQAGAAVPPTSGELLEKIRRFFGLQGQRAP
ncbi:MAG: mechanosensitive ion channel family protein [Burkholderiales bacterium]